MLSKDILFGIFCFGAFAALAAKIDIDAETRRVVEMDTGTVLGKETATREELARLCELFKRFTVPLQGFRPINEAIITKGGVDVRQVSPKTMCAKSVSGLYFAGEVLDVDAYTGGFNLQIAFSTAVVAGESAAIGEE